jgi:hypothetical protein
MQEYSPGRSKWKPGAVLVASLALVAALLFCPWETVVVQEWKMQILDESGHAIKGMPLREMWCDPAVESLDHTADLTTDADGFVVFPRRMVKANTLWRIARKAFIAIVPHQGEDHPTASIIVLGRFKPVTDEPYYVPGRPLAKQIVVRRPAALSR